MKLFTQSPKRTGGHQWMYRSVAALIGLVLTLGFAGTAAAATSDTTAQQVTIAAGSRSVVTPEFQLVAVHPRVRGGGFNGIVAWNEDYIKIWGELWSFRGDTYVYLSWNSPTHHNQAIEVAGQGNHKGVPVHTFQTLLNPSNIAVTVCNTSGGWHCGTPVRV